MTLEIKPTRIVKAPEWRAIPGWTNKKTRWFTCDDGREYTIKTLAKAINLSESVLNNRIFVFGWESLLVLRSSAEAKQDGYKAVKEKHRQRREAKQNPVPATTVKVTRANLAAMRGPGSWERQNL